MSDGMRRELAYLSSHATNRYFIPNWGTIGIRASTTFGIGNWMSGSVSVTGIYRHDKSSDFFDLPFNRKHISAILAGNLSAQLSRSHHIHFILNPFYQSKAIQGLYDIKGVFF